MEMAFAGIFYESILKSHTGHGRFGKILIEYYEVYKKVEFNILIENFKNEWMNNIVILLDGWYGRDSRVVSNYLQLV